VSKFDSKEVSYAVMHTVEHTPNTGQFGPTLSSKGDARLPSIKMSLAEPWVALEVPNKAGKGVVTVLVPITNFKTIVLAHEKNS
jgi:hypothetical protein